MDADKSDGQPGGNPAFVPQATTSPEWQTRLAATLDALPDILFVLDRHGRVLDFHAPSRIGLYVPPDRFLGQKADGLLPEPAGAVVRQAIAEALATGHHQGGTYALAMPNGERWFELSIAAHGDLNSDDARLVVIARDVTDRKQVEDALRESEEKYRLQTEGMKDVVWILDVESQRFTYVSPSVFQLRGYTADEILAQPLEEAWTPEERERLVHLLQGYVAYFLAGRITEETYVPIEFHQPCKDGSVVPSEAICHLVRNRQTGRLELHGVTRDIAARVRVERALRESETRFAETTRQSRAFVWEVDAEGRYMFVTPVVEDVLGYRPDEIAGRLHFDDLHPPEDRAEFRAAIFAAMARREKFRDYENPLVAKDGRTMWVSTNAIPLLDENGALLGYRGVDFDVTARKLAEDALRESEARTRAVQDNLPDGLVYQIDSGADGQTRRFTFISQGVERLHGVSAEEALRNPMAIYGQVLPEDLRDVAVREAHAAKTQTPLRVEVRVRLPNGEIRWRRFTSAPRRLPNGHLVWDGIEIDVTDRKLAEEALRQSEARFAASTQASRSYVWEMDPEGLITYVSPMVQEVLGRRPDEIVGHLHFYDLLPEVDREEVKAFGLALMARREAIRGFENRNVAQDGRLVWVSSSATPSYGADGSFRGYQGIDTDITARKQAEEALQASETRYRGLIDFAVDGILLGSPDGVITEANACMCALAGRPRRELVGRHVAELFAPETLDATPMRFDLVNEGETVTRVRKLIRPDASEVFVEMHSKLMPDGTYQSILHDITQRRQTDEALRRSEAKYRQLHESMRDPFASTDLKGNLLDFNPAFVDLLGYSRAELLGRNFRDITPRKWHALEKKIIAEQVRKHGYSSVYEKEYVRKDGSVVPVELRTILACDAGGKPTGMSAVIRDVSERRQAELALKKSEAKYRQLHEWMQEAFVIADMKGRLVECNPAFEALIGYSHAEVARLHYADITPAKWRAVDARAIKQVLRHGSSGATEKEYIRKDGTVVPVEMTGTLIRDTAGKPVGVSAIIHDITERKRAEAELRQAHDDLERRVRERTAELVASQQELTASEEQFRQMAESILEVFWLLDLKTGRVLYVSPAFETLWGRPCESLADGFADWLATLHPDDQAGVARDFKRGVRTGTFTPMEYRIVRPDGSLRWIRDSAWGIRDARGRIVRVAGVFRDITEQRRLESEILQATETERQRIGRDLHDGLGQSLTAIGYLADAVRENLARAKRPEAADVRKLGRLIGQTAAEAHALARGLLLADVRRGGLAAALQELAFRTQELFDVACRFAGPGPLPPLDVQAAGQLYRIAQEAATNAAKHGRARRIEIRLANQRRGLLLSVRDNGRGLPARKKSASGLGLDIMRYRAGLIGATLWIDSQPRRGTTVNCLLPRAAPARKTTR